MRWLERLADRRERVREKTISLTPTFKHLQRSILPVITRILRRRWRGDRGGRHTACVFMKSGRSHRNFYINIINLR